MEPAQEEALMPLVAALEGLARTPDPDVAHRDLEEYGMGRLRAWV